MPLSNNNLSSVVFELRAPTFLLYYFILKCVIQSIFCIISAAEWKQKGKLACNHSRDQRVIALRTELKPVFDHGLGKKQFNAGLPRCNMKLNVDFRTKRGLKQSTELELFRRLEKLSSKPSAKQINYDGIIDFLRLCQNPAFAKID